MKEITIKLYRFGELPLGAQQKAIADERIYQRDNITAMIKALFQQNLKPFSTDVEEIEINFETGDVMVTGVKFPAVMTGPQMDEIDLAMDATIATAKEELPLLLSDKYMIANIEADEEWYLANGELWMYGEAA